MHLRKIDPIAERLGRLDEQLAVPTPLIDTILLYCPAVPAAVGFILGISIQHLFALCWYWPAAIACISFVLSFLLNHLDSVHRRAFCFTLLSTLMFCCLGMFRLAYFELPYRNDARGLLRPEPYPATLRGVIISDIFKENRKSWVYGGYQFAEPSRSFYLDLQAYQTQTGSWANARGTIRVQIAQPASHIQPMDSIEFYCVVNGFKGPANPGQFDFQRYMHNRGVYLNAIIETSNGITIIGRPAGISFRKIILWLQKFSWNALLEEMPDQSDQRSAMATALLLGFQQNIDSVVNEAFIRTGLTHVISLSGMHLAIIGGMVWWLAKLAGLSKRWRAIMIFIVITLYAIIIPPRAPTLRSVVICWVLCAAMIFRRNPHPVNSLSIAAIILLFFRPTDLFYPDWQLSYGTIFGILLLYRPILRWMQHYTLEKIQNLTKGNWLKQGCYFVAQIIVEVFAAGFAAWAGGAGILLWHFGSIVPLCPLWTALVSPIVPVILYLGFFKILLAGLFPTFAAVLGWIVLQCSALFIWAVQQFAEWDFTSLRFGPVPGWLTFAYYALIGFWLIKRHLPKWCKLLPIGLSFLLIVGFYTHHTAQKDQLTLTCLSVGHGQAVVLSSPEGKTYLFDGGSITNKDPGIRTIMPYLKYRGIQTLEAVFISHGDLDHYNALPEVAKAGLIQAVYANAGFLEKARKGDTPCLLSKTLQQQQIPLKSIDAFAPADKPVRIRTLWPVESGTVLPLSENEGSEVFLIEYAGRTILLCGDIELYAQQQIIKQNPDLKADIMILPHHGSTTNLSEDFVRKVTGNIVIASCSQNRIANAYKPNGVQQIFYTGRDGAVEVKIKADGTISAVGFVESR